jgi:hypothetical protein
MAANSDDGPTRERVLARQEIDERAAASRRRRAPRRQGPRAAAGSASSGASPRDILAVFSFVGSIGLFCPVDVQARRRAGPAVSNLIGPAGHKIASGLSADRVCAYLAPVALFYTSRWRCSCAARASPRAPGGGPGRLRPPPPCSRTCRRPDRRAESRRAGHRRGAGETLRGALSTAARCW